MVKNESGSGPGLYALDAIPEACPCGQGIILQVIVGLARKGVKVYTCPSCSRAWSLETGEDLGLAAKAAKSEPASCHGAVWRNKDGSCGHASHATPAPKRATATKTKGKPGEQQKLPLPPAPPVATTMKTKTAPPTPAVIAEHNARAREAVAAGDTTLLGWTVFYSFKGEVSETDFGLAWEAVGLPEKLAPGLGARGALGKALRSLDTDFKEHYCRDDSKGPRCVYALITKDKEADRHQLVTYDSSDKSLTFENGFMEQEIRALFTKYNATLLSSEITEALRRVLAGVRAIPLKDGGGIWFVPVSQQETVARLEALAAKVSGLSVTAIDMTDKVKHRTVVRESATDALKTDLDNAAKSLATLLEAKDEKGETRDVRSSTLARRIAEYRRLREKATCYRELVEMDVAVVDKQLAELEAKVKTALDAKTSAEESK